MTASSLAASPSGRDDRPDEPENNTGPLPPPQLTKSEILKSKIAPRSFYDRVLPYYEMTMAYHRRNKTPPSQWEPPAIVGHKLSEPYMKSADDVQRQELAEQVDPQLDEIEMLSSQVEELLENLDKMPDDITPAESNNTHSGHGAVDRHDQLTERIEMDREAGHDYHNRAPVWLMILAALAPWLESIGFLAFLTLYLNVPLLQPWSDWFSWTFAVSLVTIYILAQTYLVHLAAVAHNHAREEQAKGNRHQAERLRRKRNFLLGGVGIVAAGITAALVARGQASLEDDTKLAIVVLMVVLAGTAGLLMPLLAYLGRATDGSKVSRERDNLAEELDASEAIYDETVTKIESTFVRTDDQIEDLVEKTFPAIISNAQSNMDSARPLYALLRLQIGTLPKEPPKASSASITKTESGFEGWISSGILGAESLSLQPLIDRANRLSQLRKRLAALKARFEARHPHPWNHGVQP
jgi:hypothetical protein